MAQTCVSFQPAVVGTLHHFVGFTGGWFGADSFLGLVEHIVERHQLHFQEVLSARVADITIFFQQ